MPTNTAGDNARLFPWHVLHYIVRGGPNDPATTIGEGEGVPAYWGTSISGAGTADGAYLSAWKTTPAGVTSQNFVTLPPLPGIPTGSVQPGYIPLPRTQSMGAGSGIGGVGMSASLTSVTGNAGGVYLGTIPQGAWIDSIEMFIYAGFTAPGGVTDIGIFYAQAGAYSSSNTAGQQPGTVYPLAFLTGGGAAGTLYSTELANGSKTAFTSTGGTTAPNVGPGLGTSNFTIGSLASISDIDLYFCVYGTGTASSGLTTGSAAVRIEFSGLGG